jgi:hypothetical protein
LFRTLTRKAALAAEVTEQAMRGFWMGVAASIAADALLALSFSPASAGSANDCNRAYSANRTSIRASGHSKESFLAACIRRTSDAAAPTVATAAPAYAPVRMK